MGAISSSRAQALRMQGLTAFCMTVKLWAVLQTHRHCLLHVARLQVVASDEAVGR